MTDSPMSTARKADGSAFDRWGLAEPPVLAHVVRSGFVEGRHHGTLVGLAADGSTAFALGPVDRLVFPRSCNKPMQAVGMTRAGLDVPDELLAVAAASHSGEPFHLAAVRDLLAVAGLDTAALRTTPGLPLDEEACRAHLAAGGAASPLTHNCSGKHAAMLVCCVAQGWPTDSYLAPDHPLQTLLRGAVAELAGEPVRADGVDGCGAPLFAISLLGLARAFRALTLAEPGTARRRVADAMRAHPERASGTRRLDAKLIRGVPGLLVKSGAEAVYAGALPDGRAFAIKIEDGASRAVGPVAAAALRRLGVSAPVLDQVAETPVLGGGRPVGSVRAAGALTPGPGC